MSSYGPPTEDTAIFDTIYFKQGEEFLTQNQADRRYLRFPNAQGTENLAAINVNGLATFNANIVCSTIEDLTGTLTLDAIGTTITGDTEIQGFLNMNAVVLADRRIDMNGGEIHQVSLVHSQNNNDITIEAKGTGDVILETATIPRLTISDTGFQTFQGGMTYNNATNTLTAGTFSGTATNANNVLVTSDNTSGTYYIPFVKTSGTGNKPLFMDDATGPFTFNPSTQTLSLGASVASQGGQYFVRGPAGDIAIQAVGDGGGTSRNLQIYPKSLAGTNNPSVAVDDTTIVGTSGAGAGTNVLRLTTNSATNASVRLTGTSVLMGAGGTSATATTSITTDGTAGNIVMNTNSTARLTINQTGEVVYNYWDCGNPFLFDDFTAFQQLTSPFSWFPNVSTLGAGRAVYSGTLDSGQGTKLTSRIGILNFFTGANNNSDNFICSSERIIRPVQVKSITWGFVDCGTGTLASFTTPSSTNVTKSFGCYNTTTPNADDSDLGGIIWRRSSANSTAQNWQFYVNNVAVTNGTGPETNVCNHCRITIEFQLSGGNYQTRGIFVNLNNGNSFTSDWVNVPTNPTTGDSALVLGQHLRNNGDASARVLGIDYCLIQNASRAINRGTDQNITR